jgi:hypothetical protein
MFVLRVEMYKLCSAIYRTTLFTTLIDLDIDIVFHTVYSARCFIRLYARVEGLNIQDKIL